MILNTHSKKNTLSLLKSLQPELVGASFCVICNSVGLGRNARSMLLEIVSAKLPSLSVSPRSKRQENPNDLNSSGWHKS